MRQPSPEFWQNNLIFYRKSWKCLKQKHYFLSDTPAYNAFMDNGFKDVFEGHHSSTFHGFTGSDTGGHIDWIFYRGKITVKNRAIIRKSFFDIYPSDHFPVMARLSF